MEIEGLAFTGNVLLVADLKMVVGWLVPVCNGRAGHDSSLWAISSLDQTSPPESETDSESEFAPVACETGAVYFNGNTLHTYNTRTGDLLKPAKGPPVLGLDWCSLRGAGGQVLFISLKTLPIIVRNLQHLLSKRGGLRIVMGSTSCG